MIFEFCGKKGILIHAAISLGLALASSASYAAPDADRLGKDLTPVGAELVGNKDGSVPRWEGKDQPVGNWTWGKYRGDHWKFKDEKSLFSIDAANVDKHADKLSPGQVALIKQIKGYRVDVYPSHRNCGHPQWVSENTKRNVKEAKLASNGHDLNEAVLPGVPFPMPQNGSEAMWNYKTRYAGLGWNMDGYFAFISPRKGSTEWSEIGQSQFYLLPWGGKGGKKRSEIPAFDSMTYSTLTSPAALAGMAVVINTSFNADTESFMYFPGQRRVRRMPNYAYDSPFVGFENQYTNDMPFGFLGRMDRFDWKLVGKKEIYIQYNAFGMNDFRKKRDDVFTSEMAKPEYRRYELHRVWIIEATVKTGVRHISPKRTFYLDEDTWNIGVAEDYDAQGKLWKVRETSPMPVWELGGACTYTTFINYDLVNGRFLTDIQPVGASKDIQWFAEPDGTRFSVDYYTADNLRALSER